MLEKLLYPLVPCVVVAGKGRIQDAKKQYGVVATGGTFDMLHKGHRLLLDTAFAVSDMVIIGLTSDEMLASHRTAAKQTRHNYDQRLANLRQYLHESGYPDSSYAIHPLYDEFGPAVMANDVQALVTSDETARKTDVLNKMRAEAGLAPVDAVSIPMVMARDQVRISSSRIRRMEIDADGNSIQ